MQGSATLSDGRPFSERHLLFLPSGWQPRVDGWFGFQRFTFDGGGGTGDLCAAGGCPLSFAPSKKNSGPAGWSLRLNSGDHCAHFHYASVSDLSGGGDMVRILNGDLSACPVVDTFDLRPSIGATIAGDMFGVRLGTALPDSAIVVDLSAPVDDATATNIALVVNGAAVAADVAPSNGRFVLTPASKIPVGAKVEVSTAGMLTVMGSAVPPPPPLAGLVTTAVLADWALSTPPTPGSVAAIGLVPSFTAGTGLCISDTGRYPRTPFAAVIALGEISAPAVRVTFDASSRYTSYTQIAVARADGTTGTAGSLGPLAMNLLDLAVPAGTGTVSLVIWNGNMIPEPTDLGPDLVFCLHAISTP